ncbi:hypothetical protein C0993_010472 [Termitomyces sp. T159_Od127]|nr:hypothetical protein C0993_010472 [Termitomyces sp. T159_Od127]
MDFSESFAHLPSTPLISSARAGPSKSSGLTLVLPALKGGKPIKVGKKSGSYVLQDEEKKAPRPVKLKPLKEVLAKLIVQIKKKDDYAFFLKPVDASQVPGYTDVVKRPMDLGTMSLKVARGKYRSLEDFAADLRLVASNAKAFNPPGSIYYTEAERIEAWGLDHIAKAAATVIQYETDWNIEIEKDDEATPVVIDDDDDYNVGTPMDVDDVARRSPSVSAQVQPLTGRRGVRGPYKKTAQAPSNKVSESVDTEGRLPGSKDGLGSFPPCSAWAQTMVALKLKGKRYKTKKERLRFEKEGPPLHADGSLDYTEMEDPFSVLSVLAPEPETRPYLTQLHPPLFTMPPQYDPSSSQSQSNTPRAQPPYYPPVNLYLERPPSQSASTETLMTKRRHWTIIRNPTRSKQKDFDEAEAQDAPPWQTPREIQATDYGSFAVLAGSLEEEIRQRRIAGREGEEEEKIVQVLRGTLDCEVAPINLLEHKKDISVSSADYWSTQRASTAEEYIRDIVYGGIDGLAYVRSLAEFVSNTASTAPCMALGMPVTTWVEQEIIDPLTEGRHSLLRETAIELARQKLRPSHQNPSEKHFTYLFDYVRNSLQLYPVVAAALVLLMQIETQKIDMGALIRTPDELFQSEEEWAGKVFRENRRARKKEDGKSLDDTHHQETEEPEKTWMDVDASSINPNGEDVDYEPEGPEELRQVMDYVAGVLIDLDKRIKAISTSSMSLASTHVPSLDTQDCLEIRGKDRETEDASEDPVLRNLRLNLLALAKRAPLDTIARLPKDLVPEHIRHFVPTLSSST